MSEEKTLKRSQTKTKMSKSKETENLPKSKSHIDPKPFMDLYGLMKERAWIEDEWEALIDLWNLCENNQQQKLIISLLERFKLINSRDLKNYCEDIAKHICDTWGITNRATKIVALSDGKTPDGSQLIIQAIKNNFASRGNWAEENFRNNLITIGKTPYQLRSGQSIILIDDFIGTGKTAQRKIRWLKNEVDQKGKKDITIYCVSLACMKSAVSIVEQLGVILYSPLVLEKGITDFFGSEDVSKYIEQMLGIESKLNPVNKGERLPSLGYGKSESLFAIEGINVPNNVFPAFWWPLLRGETERKTIFQRIR